MSSTRTYAAALLGWALAIVQPGLAVADEANAAKSFAAGSSAFSRGEFRTAAAEFERAYQEEPHPAPLYNAGLAWLAAGRMDHAADAFAAALEMDGLSAEQATDAQQRLRDSEKSLSVVTLVGAPRSAKARIDDGPLLDSRSRFHALPGAHKVTLADGDFDDSRAFNAARAEPVQVQFGGSSSEDVPPLLIASIGLFGAAAVFGGAAIGTGITGLSARDEAVLRIDQGVIDQTTEDLIGEAESLKIATNVLWTLSALSAVGGGVVLLLSFDKAPEAPPAAKVTVGPRGLFVTGTF
jgi:tetratricopeptide (TPR) repeat protein